MLQEEDHPITHTNYSIESVKIQAIESKIGSFFNLSIGIEQTPDHPHRFSSLDGEQPKNAT